MFFSGKNNSFLRGFKGQNHFTQITHNSRLIYNTCLITIILFTILSPTPSSSILITQPPNIAGTYEAVRATFSGVLPAPSPDNEAEIVWAYPTAPCGTATPILNTAEVAGKIVVASNPNCPAIKMAQAVVAAGGKALFQLRDDPSPNLMEYYPGSYVTIPSIETYFGAVGPILEALANGTQVFGRIETAPCQQDQTNALLSFWNAAGGPAWARGGAGSPEVWNTSTDPCQSWFGVNCNEQGLVTHLILEQNNLVGTLPDDFSAFTSLLRLQIDNNLLSGTVPSGVGAFSDLLTAQLSFNAFTGAIPPGLFSIIPLINLDLNDNKFQGTIADMNLPFLTDLSLGDNMLTGTIPPSLNSLASLQSLSIGGNSLTGVIPDLTQMTSLISLDVSNNQLQGTIPDSLGLMLGITSINLANNQFIGGIPDSFVNLSELLSLDVNHNNLSIDPATQLMGLTSLLYLDISYNSFTGPVFTNLPMALQSFYASHNQFTSVPTSFGNLINLVHVDLSHNMLQSAEDFYSMPQITAANILAGINGLITLDMSYNMIALQSYSVFEIYLNQLPALTTLSLSNNLINGTLFLNPTTHKYISMIDLSSNYFSGQIPGQFGEWTTLRNLVLDNNLFHHDTGPLIPSFMVVNEDIRSVNNSANWECPSLTASFPVEILIDNSYHDFQLCHCVTNFRRDNSTTGSASPYEPLIAPPLHCSECPDHMICPGSLNDTTFLFVTGFYPTPSPQTPLAMIPCTNCDNRDNLFTCVVGTGGRLCSECSQGYFPRGDKCEICSPWGILLIAAAVVFVVGVIMFFAIAFGKCGYMSQQSTRDEIEEETIGEIHKKAFRDLTLFSRFKMWLRNAYNKFLNVRSMAILSLVINYYQTMSILIVQSPFSVSLKVLLSLISISNISGTGFGLECFNDHFRNYNIRYLGVVLQPTAVVLVIGLIFVIGYAVIKSKNADVSWWKYMCGRSLFFMVNFFYFPVMVTTLNVFVCSQDPGTGILYLAQEPYATCDTISTGVKIVFIFINIILIFFVFGAILWYYLRTPSPSHAFSIEKYFGFFFLHFRKDYVPVAMFLMARRLLFSLFTSLLPTGSMLQFTMNSFLLLISIVATHFVKPYRRTIDNHMEVVSFSVLLLSYSLVSMGVFADEIDTSAHPEALQGFAVAEAIFILINILLVLWFAYVLIPSKIITTVREFGRSNVVRTFVVGSGSGG